MKRTENTSSSPRTDQDRLIRIPLERLLSHPANPNVMDETRLEKLAANIKRQDDYPPLIVRPHPEKSGYYQKLDGHWRAEVLKRLGYEEARCYVWPCDDEMALMLLATLNRLEGQDDPAKRAELLQQLTEMASVDDLGALLPEDAGDVRRSLAFLDLNLDDLLADLQREATVDGLRSITFAVSPEDEATIEEAVAAATDGLEGRNRRGRAVAAVARAYLDRGQP